MALSIPVHFRHRRATPFWDRQTAPQALFTNHQNEADVYCRLSVMQGAVKLFCFADQDASDPVSEIVIEAGHTHIILPLCWFSIALVTDESYFNLDYFAEPSMQSRNTHLSE